MFEYAGQYLDKLSKSQQASNMLLLSVWRKFPRNKNKNKNKNKHKNNNNKVIFRP